MCNYNLTTYLTHTPILTFAPTLTLLAHMRARGQESGVKRQVQLFDQMSDQEDISLVRVTDYSHGLQSRITVRDYSQGLQSRITVTNYSHELQSWLMNQRSGPEDKVRVRVRVEGYGSG